MHRVFVFPPSLVSPCQRSRPQCVQCTNKRNRRNAQCYSPVRTYGAMRQQIHFMCFCVSSTHGDGCSAHGSCCLFPSWMENAERYVKSSHLPPCEVKHHCFVFLKIIWTTISNAHGLIKHFTFANVSVTGDCWTFSPFIKWCKAAGEKRREGITQHFLNCSTNLLHLQLKWNALVMKVWEGQQHEHIGF